MLALATERVETDTQLRADLHDFSRWMVSEQQRIFLLCRRMLQDRDEADSATQDVFLKAYQALSRRSELAELDNPGKWVTRIAVNTCLDRLRSKAWKLWQRRLPIENEDRIVASTPGRTADAEAQLFAKQIQNRLESALMTLSSRQRAVFSLRHFEGMPLEDIAEMLKLDIGTVKAHLFRAIAKLRTQLKDLYTA